MPIPPSFLRSFSEMAGGGAASSRIAALNTPVSITSEGQSLTITASTAVITGDEPAAKFKTDALKVDWSNRDAIIFTIRAKDGDIASLQAAKLYFDIYIDINHRARSGSTALLPNRPMAFIISRGIQNSSFWSVTTGSRPVPSIPSPFMAKTAISE